MNAFKLVTTADGMQHAIATADGIRYDMYIIGGEPLTFKVIERATAAAIDGDDITAAAKDSLIADGVKLNGIDVIVTETSETTTTAAQTFHPYSLNGVAIGLINEHATAIADILKEYERNTSSTAIAAHADAIRNITRTLHNHLKTL